MAEKYLEYFNENAPENVDDIITICEASSKVIWDKFRVRYDDPRLLATCFSKIFDAFLNKLESLEADYSNFTINVCDRLAMGYTTNEDEDDEKVGNFMVFIRHMHTNKKKDETDDPTAKATERAMCWNTENIVEQPELIRKISIDAIEELKKVEIFIGSSEFIMPIFVTTYEAIVNYIKIKRKELDSFDFEINFISCFYIGARESEDEIDEIYIRPNIESKLKLKNDTKASSKFE